MFDMTLSVTDTSRVMRHVYVVQQGLEKNAFAMPTFLLRGLNNMVGRGVFTRQLAGNYQALAKRDAMHMAEHKMRALALEKGLNPKGLASIQAQRRIAVDPADRAALDAAIQRARDSKNEGNWWQKLRAGYHQNRAERLAERARGHASNMQDARAQFLQQKGQWAGPLPSEQRATWGKGNAVFTPRVGVSKGALQNQGGKYGLDADGNPITGGLMLRPGAVAPVNAVASHLGMGDNVVGRQLSVPVSQMLVTGKNYLGGLGGGAGQAVRGLAGGNMGNLMNLGMMGAMFWPRGGGAVDDAARAGYQGYQGAVA